MYKCIGKCVFYLIIDQVEIVIEYIYKIYRE